MKLPEVTPAAEHLKSVVQTVLGAFQTGAGICNGLPEPMTFELAVQTLWREIDRVFYSEWPRDAHKRIQLRISKEAGTLEELMMLLNVCGVWTVRASIRNNNLVAHVVGILNRNTKPDSVIGFFNKEGWKITDFNLGMVM